MVEEECEGSEAPEEPAPEQQQQQQQQKQQPAAAKPPAGKASSGSAAAGGKKGKVRQWREMGFGGRSLEGGGLHVQRWWQRLTLQLPLLVHMQAAAAPGQRSLTSFFAPK